MRFSWEVVRSNLRHALAGAVPGANRALLKGIYDTVRENQAVLGQIALPPTQAWQGRPVLAAGGPAENAFPACALCRQESFEEPYFAYWAQRIGHRPSYHRKLWEFVFICQVLFERGFLQHGFRALGFGVGEEPLAAFFASQGCKVVGTDLAAESAQAAGWTKTLQHAGGKDSLRMPWVCPEDLFERNVVFRSVDMNHIPGDLKDFDFCWSACAFEHLGTIEKGLAFIENTIATLRPGGLAVHTTEFNLTSNDMTEASGPTVLFRRRDFEELARRLAAKGHLMAPLDLDPGVGLLDRYIDVPPYRQEPHLKMVLAGYATTSIGIIVQKGGN